MNETIEFDDDLTNEDGDLLYGAFRVGRSMQDQTVHKTADENREIEVDDVAIFPIASDDGFEASEGVWTEEYLAPGPIDRQDPDHVYVFYERLHIHELPRPMTSEEFGNWVENNQNEWKPTVIAAIEEAGIDPDPNETDADEEVVES